MFDTLIESGAGRNPTNKRWTIAASALGQTLALSALILIPLLHTQALPRTLLGGLLLAPPPRPTPPRPQPSGTAQPRRTFKRQVVNGKITAPNFIPKDVLVLDEPELLIGPGGDGDVGNVFGGLFGGPGSGLAGPRQEKGPAPPPVKLQRIRQGGVVQRSLLLSQAKLAYPPLAMQARVQGVVVLRAVIDTEGGVAELQAISGPPLLVKAAIDGVRQWRYRPTLLNGEPVEVDTTITVTFTLAN